MTTKEIIALVAAAILTAFFAIMGWSIKSNITHIYDQIKAVEVASAKANEIQWGKINSLEKDIAYLKGFREGYRCGAERKPEHP